MNDYIKRKPIRVQSLCLPSEIENEHTIRHQLPSEYLYENGILSFPAGFLESYIIDGKDYNYDENYSLDEQKELVLKDLVKEGYKLEEAEELIDKIEIKEGNANLLNFDKSLAWLELHPKFRRDALQLLNEARINAQTENQSEPARKIKKR